MNPRVTVPLHPQRNLPKEWGFMPQAFSRQIDGTSRAAVLHASVLRGLE